MNGAAQYGGVVASDLGHLGHRHDLDGETMVGESFGDPFRYSCGRAVIYHVCHQHSRGATSTVGSILGWPKLGWDRAEGHDRCRE
jgi:hypothetical protein